ncbi:hypothetical protein Tco_1523098 [Tanacetum coccineum]
MSYEDIRLIFERVWDQNHAFVPKDSEIEKEVMKRPGFDFQQKSINKNDKIKQAGSSKKRSREDSDEDNAKKQKLEDEAKKEELRASMDIAPRDDVPIDVESLATKYPIVDWKTYVLTENMMYYQIIRADGSSKNYKIFSEMLDDFDRQDVMDLHRLVQERLFDSCGIHILLMHTGIAIHMMIEKKYPLTQEMLSRMLSRRLKVDQESEMAFKRLRGGLLGIKLIRLSTARRMLVLLGINIVMSDSKDSTVTYTEAPPSPDYVSGLEEPEQAPPSPVYVPYIPEPVYPEFMLPEDEVFPAEERPLLAAVSPTADSPGYVPELDPEEDLKDDDDEDPEEDPADYPADGGDDGDDEDESSNDDEDDDVDIEGDEEEEEYPALADSTGVALPAVDHAPSAEETEPFEIDESAATPPPHPAYRVTARISIQDKPPTPFWSDTEVARLLAIPTLPPSPLSPWSSPLP